MSRPLATIEGNRAIFAALKRAQAADLEIPPKVFLDMQGEFLRYETDKSLSARFPVLERYENPLGYMQGGLIAAAMDNTLGPLSYLSAPPSVTTQMTVRYLRPVPKGSAWLLVDAVLVERTRRQLFLSAKAKNEADKVIALAEVSCTVIDL